MPAMGWLKDLVFARVKDDAKQPTCPYDCVVRYADGAKDVFHFYAVDVADALKLAAYWMPTRDTAVVEVRMSVRQVRP